MPDRYWGNGSRYHPGQGRQAWHHKWHEAAHLHHYDPMILYHAGFLHHQSKDLGPPLTGENRYQNRCGTKCKFLSKKNLATTVAMEYWPCPLTGSKICKIKMLSILLPSTLLIEPLKIILLHQNHYPYQRLTRIG